ALDRERADYLVPARHRQGHLRTGLAQDTLVGAGGFLFNVGCNVESDSRASVRDAPPDRRFVTDFDFVISLLFAPARLAGTGPQNSPASTRINQEKAGIIEIEATADQIDGGVHQFVGARRRARQA